MTRSSGEMLEVWLTLSREVEAGSSMAAFMSFCAMTCCRLEILSRQHRGEDAVTTGASVRQSQKTTRNANTKGRFVIIISVITVVDRFGYRNSTAEATTRPSFSSLKSGAGS